MSDVAAWVLGHPALRVLTLAVGGAPVPPAGLSRWAAEHLDSRDGHERQHRREVTLDDGQAAAVFDAAESLGMVSPVAPTRSAYDVTVVLGGTATANRLRTAFAFGLAADGRRLGTFLGLASDRVVGAEEAIGTDATPGATEASDLYDVVSRHLPPESADATVLSAPSTRPGRRADTRDAATHLADMVAPSGRRHVLLVTSAVYAPYQLLVAAPVLLADGTVTVEIVGTPTGTGHRSPVRAQAIAQEINGLIQIAGAITSA